MVNLSELLNVTNGIVLNNKVSDKSFNDIILDTFSQLDKFCVSEKTYKKGQKIGKAIKSEIESIKAEMDVVYETSSEQKFTRLLPTRLTPQKLAELFRETGQIWMIEDFHKLSRYLGKSGIAGSQMASIKTGTINKGDIYHEKCFKKIS